MLKNIIIIIIIFAILILGQQIYFRNIGKEAYRKISEWGSGYWQKGQDYWDKNILHKATAEIEKRQNIAKEEIKEQAKKTTKNIWEKTKDYISGLLKH